MNDSNWTPSRVRANFRVDLFGAICAGTFISVLATFMPIVVRRMGGSATDVAIVVAAPFVGHLLAPLFGYGLAHVPPVRVVAGASTLSRLVFIAGVLVAATPLMLAVTTVVFWVVAIANISAYAALMQGIYPDRERAQAMGKVRIGAAVAGLVSATVAGALIDAVPAAIVFAVAAAISLPGPLFFFRIRHDPAPHESSRRRAVDIAREVWSDRRYRRLLVSFLVFGWGNLMCAAVYPLVIVDRFDAPNTFVGVMAAVQSATAILAYPIAGRLIDRGSSLRQTYIATLLTVLIPVGYAVSPVMWGMLPVSVIAGITIASSDITFYTNLVQLAPRGRIGEYAAAQSLLLGLRGTLAPFASSVLLALVLPRGVLIVGIAFMVVGSILMGAAVREPRPLPQPVEVEPART